MGGGRPVSGAASLGCGGGLLRDCDSWPTTTSLASGRGFSPERGTDATVSVSVTFPPAMTTFVKPILASRRFALPRGWPTKFVGTFKLGGCGEACCGESDFSGDGLASVAIDGAGRPEARPDGSDSFAPQAARLNAATVTVLTSTITVRSQPITPSDTFQQYG